MSNPIIPLILIVMCLIINNIIAWILYIDLSITNEMIDCIYSNHTIEVCKEILGYTHKGE